MNRITVHGGHHAGHRTPHGHDARRYGGAHQGCGRGGRLRLDQRSHPRSAARLEDEAQPEVGRTRSTARGHRQGHGRSVGGPGHRLRHGQDHRTREEVISRTLPLRLTDAAEADLAEIWAYLAVEVSEATATLQLARHGARDAAALAA